MSVPVLTSTACARRQPVHFFVPDNYDVGDPVLFVMHGVKRNAMHYRDAWAPLGRKHRALVLCPEFSDKQFPTARAYNLGHVRREDGTRFPHDEWAFSAIETIFDEVRARMQSTRTSYSIYGHSAGAQFVHRYLYFVPEARVDHVVSANAGWYTVPDPATKFPYGLGTTEISDDTIRAMLQKKVVVLLGTADTDVKHKKLRHTAQAELQGPHRLARGQYFFAQAEKRAGELGVPFAWHLVYAENIAHQNRKISHFAAKWLFEEQPATTTS